MWNPRVLVLYQGRWGSVDPERRAVRFQGIPGGVARGSIPGRIAASTPKRGAVCSQEDSRRYDILSYTSEATGGSGVMEILRLYQGSLKFR